MIAAHHCASLRVPLRHELDARSPKPASQRPRGPCLEQGTHDVLLRQRLGLDDLRAQATLF
jgi:hypothetical protein